MQDEVVPHHDKWEEKGEVDRELWLKAGENGLLGINIPEEKGGLGKLGATGEKSELLNWGRKTDG